MFVEFHLVDVSEHPNKTQDYLPVQAFSQTLVSSVWNDDGWMGQKLTRNSSFLKNKKPHNFLLQISFFSKCRLTRFVCVCGYIGYTFCKPAILQCDKNYEHMYTKSCFTHNWNKSSDFLCI